MAHFHFKAISIALIAGATLTACEDGQNINLFGGEQSETRAVAANGEVPIVERDVEMPDIFYRAEEGLWDGRPSLGGIWVAHPDVTNPERVKIVNENNGREIMGALFRRERANPGPSFQISSDAATDLGILAGSPTPIKVTAIRTQEVPIAPLVPEVDETGEGEITATTLDGADSDGASTDPIASLAASAIETATSASTATASSTLKPEARPARETAAAETPETAPAAPQSSALAKPFVQVGIFSIKENADAASDALKKGGVVPIVKKFTSNDKTYWRLIVGPLATAAERGAMVKKIQGLGFVDAYPVSN